MGAPVDSDIEYFDEITMLKAMGRMWRYVTNCRDAPCLVSAARTQFFGSSFLGSLWICASQFVTIVSGAVCSL